MHEAKTLSAGLGFLRKGILVLFLFWQRCMGRHFKPGAVVPVRASCVPGPCPRMGEVLGADGPLVPSVPGSCACPVASLLLPLEPWLAPLLSPLLLPSCGVGAVGLGDQPYATRRGRRGTEGISSDVGWTDGALLQPRVTCARPTSRLHPCNFLFAGLPDGRL